MLALLVGGLVVAIDFTVTAYSEVTRSLPGEHEAQGFSGHRFDLVPDELGFALFATAFLWLSRVSSGGVRVGLRLLAAWQVVLIGLEISNRFVHANRTVPRPDPEWLPLANGAAMALAAWLIARVCQHLSLKTGQRRWRRAAWAETLYWVISILAGVLLGQATVETLSSIRLEVLSVVFGLHLALAIVLACLYFHACLTTWAEAKEEGLNAHARELHSDLPDVEPAAGA